MGTCMYMYSNCEYEFTHVKYIIFIIIQIYN